MPHRPTDYFDVEDIAELHLLRSRLKGYRDWCEQQEHYEAASCLTHWIDDLTVRLIELRKAQRGAQGASNT